MRVALLAMGTRGDVQPMLALAGGLRTAGHDVKLAAEARYADAARSAGLRFHEFGGNSEAFFAGPGGRVFRTSIDKPVSRYARVWSAFAAPAARIRLRACLPACVGAEVLVCQSWLGIAPSLAERFGAPAITANIAPVPELPTRAFPLPLQDHPHDLSEHDTWRSWRYALPILRAHHHTVQQWRNEDLGLGRQTFREDLDRMRATPHVLGYSPLVLPKPCEWDDHIEVTGYWAADASTDYRPPRELEDFLSSGSPPVVVGFGSHVGRDPDRLTSMVVDALAATHTRGVLLTGWGALRSARPSTGVLFAREVPHDWLLPRAAGIVHHGGSGTTATALRMGVPQLIVPFGWDTAFWARRMVALGVGLAPLSFSTLTAISLASRIEQLIADRELRVRARVLGESLRQERGIERAVAAIERFAC
jgi:sterol 3beta-glucosyltransferase